MSSEERMEDCRNLLLRSDHEAKFNPSSFDGSFQSLEWISFFTTNANYHIFSQYRHPQRKMLRNVFKSGRTTVDFNLVFNHSWGFRLFNKVITYSSCLPGMQVLNFVSRFIVLPVLMAPFGILHIKQLTISAILQTAQLKIIHMWDV